MNCPKFPAINTVTGIFAPVPAASKVISVPPSAVIQPKKFLVSIPDNVPVKSIYLAIEPEPIAGS